MSRQLSFDINEAISLFQQNPSWAAVAKKLGVARGSIMHALKPLGYEARNKCGQVRSWDIKEVLRLKEEEGMTIKEIAEKIGVTDRAIYAGLRKEKKRWK